MESIVGPVETAGYDINRFSECRWTASNADPGGEPTEIVLRIETVDEPELFITHSIESTPADRVRPLDIGQQGVMFADEAVMSRHGRHVALVTGRPIPIERLTPVLSAAVDHLQRSAAASS